MLGSIIGDIVGSRFEFHNHRSTDFALFHEECDFTDDTVCTIAVMDWLVNGAAANTFAPTLQRWCARYRGRGYGGMFRHWIDVPVPYNSFGNGSAMRVSPVGLWAASRNEALALAKQTAEVSHNHPEGIKGAQAAALAVWMARTGADKNAIRHAITQDFGYNLSFTCDEIRPTYRFNETCQDTVPQALVAFLESSDFESAIRLAISIGGDSDTLACITGGIAEAFYKTIPDSIQQAAWKFLPNEMLQVVDAFYGNPNLCQFMSASANLH
jgi:ADP-ribosylglycohydrolase